MLQIHNTVGYNKYRLLFSPNIFSCIYFNTFIFCFVTFTLFSCDSLQHLSIPLSRFIKRCNSTKVNKTVRKTKCMGNVFCKHK